MKIANSLGLTLIEVIISITILAFMMVSIIVVTNNSLDHKNIIVSEDRELLQIETALDRLNWDFSQIYTPLYHTQEFKADPRMREESQKKMRAFQENPIYSRDGRFSGPDFFGRPIPIIHEERKQAIEFFTKGHRRRFENSNESEFAWVRYEFRSYQGEDEDKKDLFELVRYYGPTNIYDGSIDLKELQATVLTNKVSEYSFFFWDEKRERWEESLSNVRGGKNILRGLKLQIKWKRGQNNIEEFASRTYRTIWPHFEPEDLNKVKYQGVGPAPRSRRRDRRRQRPRNQRNERR